MTNAGNPGIFCGVWLMFATTLPFEGSPHHPTC
jgi:hypothetical protein